MTLKKHLRIGIVGAGVSGLAAARHAIHLYGENATVTLYEKQDEVGGLWNSKPSAVYQDLRTNLPSCLVQLKGLKFNEVRNRIIPS